MTIYVTGLKAEPSGYKILVDLEGFSNKEIVEQIGVGELIAEMEIQDIMKSLDITDILDTIENFDAIKEYLRSIGEI